MRPFEIIRQAAMEGVNLIVSPTGGISAQGDAAAVERWLPALRENKADLIEMLRPGIDGWSAEDWQVFFAERAGIAEFEGEQLRP